MRQPAVDHREARAQVVDQRRNRIGVELRVEHHHDPSGAQHAEQRADEVGAVREREEDPLFRAESQSGEDVGESRECAATSL